MDPKILQGQARIAEIDLTIEKLRARRKSITDYLSKLGASELQTVEEALMPKEEYSKAFEEFWTLYAEGTGRRVEKNKSFQAFKKIKVSEYPYVKKAIENYIQGRECKKGYSKHFHRFLREDYWPAWINQKPEAEDDTRSSKDIVKGILKK